MLESPPVIATRSAPGLVLEHPTTAPPFEREKSFQSCVCPRPTAAVAALPCTAMQSITSSPAALGTASVARLVIKPAETKLPLGGGWLTPANDAAPMTALALLENATGTG